MMKKLMLWIVILCVFAIGCSRPEETIRTETLDGTETENKQEEVVQKMPVVEITPIIRPEPELLEPLWNNRVAVQYSRDIVRTKDQVSVFETDAASDIKLRLYQMGNGDRVIMGRMQNAVGEIPVYVWEIPDGVSIRWYDRAAGQWQQEPLAAGELRHSMVEFATENGASYLVYLPKTYRLMENEVLEYLPEQNGVLSIAKIGESWRLTLLASIPDQNCVSDFTMVQGSRPMLNWDHPYCGELWKNYTMDTEGKWCFDGYYWPCPDNYVPTGLNYLYACPAAYLVKSFAYAASVHPAADDLALAMLDTLALKQTADGYWPTSPQSQWLFADYGVDMGFYDTRFNMDLIEIYRVYYEYAGGDVLREAMERHTAFFTAFAEREHFTSAAGGWFVPDYTPAALQKPHCSLNHQLAECIELYHLSKVLQQPELETLADRMLLAVADTAEKWITDTGDLHYCIFPDGSFGMRDYPYLTYNDLYELQSLLIERRGAPDTALQFLIDQKRQWMDANGITGYNR